MTMPLPGWYQDPLNPDRQKWWDGAAWTEYTLPLASGAADPGTAVEPGPERSSAAEPAAEGFTGFGAPASGAQGYLGGQPSPGAQGYLGQQPQGYPGPQQGAGDARGYADPQGPPDHPGYTDQPVHPGYSGYQRGYTGSHPAYTGYPGYQGYGSPQRSNPAALTGFILGITGLFMFFIPFFGTGMALGASVVSAVGLAKQGPDRAPMYKVFAIIGLILGIIFTLLSVLVLVAIFASVPMDSGTTSTSYWAFHSS